MSHYTALRQPGNMVIPIPLHQHHYVARRCNQSAELAIWLTSADDSAPDTLLRCNHHKSLVGLSGIQLQKNVFGILSMALKSRVELFGKLVIVIGDVMATGTTLNAATACLLSAASGPVHRLLLARVL